MARILKLEGNPASELQYKTASRRRKKRVARPGQLDLFSGPARVVRLDTGLSHFDEALLLHERGDPSAADCYRRAIREADSVADSWCNLGILGSQRGDARAAQDCFSQSLQSDPQLFEAHFNLGNLHFEQGNLTAARIHYEIARSLDSSYPNLYFNLGLVLALEGRIEDAIEALSQFRELVRGADGQKADELLVKLRASLAMGR